MSNETKPLKVLLWSPFGAGLFYGGAGMAAYRLYAKSKPEQFEIDLAHGCLYQDHYDIFQRQFFFGNLRPASVINQVRFILRVKRWIFNQSNNYDIFHGLAAFHYSLLPAQWFNKMGVKTVIKLTVHNADLAPKKGIKRWLRVSENRRAWIKQVSAVIAISRDIRDELLGYGVPKEKIALIPNAVDTDLFYPANTSQRQAARERFGLRDKFTLLFVGSLTSRKQPHLLIEAVAKLVKRGHDIQLVLAGPERELGYKSKLVKLAEEFNIQTRIVFTSFTHDIAPIYHVADIFLLPSKKEGMSSALLEAMASGLPSVVTPISGSNDLIIDNVHGRHVKHDAGSISECIEFYINNNNIITEHGKAALEKICTNFTTINILRQHEDLFRKLMR